MWGNSDECDEALLSELAEGMEQMQSSDDDEDDNTEGWVDEVELLSEEERVALDESLTPIRIVIAKVSIFLYILSNICC
jgi:hypothetical protein